MQQIYNKKIYWRLRYFKGKVIFLLKRKGYQISEQAKQEVDNVKFVNRQAKATVINAIKSIIFIASIFLVEYLGNAIFEPKNRFLLPNWILRFHGYIPIPNYSRDRDAIIEFLSVIASVSGVILALFYPVLATIASTGYAKVNSNIRYLLFSERDTLGYLRILTYLTASSILSLLFLSLGLLPGNLVLGILGFGSIIALFGILKIGFGVYNFFDPSTLSKIAMQKLVESIRNVTEEGAFWEDRNFQNHNRLLAHEQLENLSLINSLCIKDGDLLESSFKKNAEVIFRIFQYYISAKQKIPTKSSWFPDTYIHRSFFESDMSSRGLSKSTMTLIQPIVQKDSYWFEDKISSCIQNGIASLEKMNRIDAVSSMILSSESLFKSLSYELNTRSASQILSYYLDSTLASLNSKAHTELPPRYDDLKRQMILLESYTMCLLKFQIFTLDRIKDYNAEKFESEFCKINFSSIASLYDCDFIPEVRKKLEQYFEYINNEKFAEGKRVTPDWYILQDLASIHLMTCKSLFNEILTLIDTNFIPLLNSSNNLNPLVLSFAGQLGLETANKIRYRLHFLRESFNSLDAFELCKKEFAWEKPDLKSAEEKLAALEDLCYSIIVSNIINISEIPWTSENPDIFGHSYSLISSRIDSQFCNNEITKFLQTFPVFLNSSLAAFNKIQKEFKHYYRPQNIAYQTLLDAMEISGYGYIYSILYGEPKYWKCISDSWNDSFLASEENIKLLVSYYGYYKNSLNGTGINFNEKFEREKSLRNTVERLQINPKGVNDWLVRQFLPTSPYNHSFYDVAELFIELYLFSFIAAKPSTSIIRRDLFDRLTYHLNQPSAAEDVFDDE